MPPKEGKKVEVKEEQLDDQWYEWKIRIESLYARQDQKNTVFYKMPELIRLVQERTEDFSQGNEVRNREIATRTTKTVRKVQQQIPLHRFEVRADGNGGEVLVAPLAGKFGIIKQAFHRVLLSMGKAKYWAPPTDLLNVFGLNGQQDGVVIGKAPADAISIEQQTMHSTQQKGRMVQVPVAWEVAKKREIVLFLKQNGVCPLGKKELEAILHGCNDIPFGPNKRGSLTGLDFAEVGKPNWTGAN